MSSCARGGHTLKTGKIGRVACLRQQLMMPGEKMNLSMQGSVRLEALRERDVMRINAHLATFMIPLRWLVSDWPQYCKEGVDTVVTIPTRSSNPDWHAIGIGSHNSGGAGVHHEFWVDAYLRCINEWYKWPEDPDVAFADIGEHGCKAVPLSASWSRCRYDHEPDSSADYTVSSTTSFDIRDITKLQARYRSAMKRERLSFGRWMELVKQTWRGDGSREVDQVPIMLDQVEVGVNPREIPATDGASLGQFQSLFDFGIDHNIRGIVAPEHCVITTLLTVRFSPTMERCNPLATNNLDWFELTADPEYLASAEPVEVLQDELMQSGLSVSYGYLPAGWQWRSDFDVIGKSVDVRDSFPYHLLPSTKEQAKDATRVKSAFRSQSLDDYMVDVYFKEDCYQPIGDSMDSYMAGMMDDAQVSPGGRGDEFPHGGKQL